MDWVKVNCDGAVTNSSGMAACGGTIRSYDGSMLMAYARNLGCCSILHVELWGIYHGLALAKNQGIRKVIIESDAIRAINKIQDGVPPSSNYY
ncbi:ribonuclease H protein, partial [Trifolium medium]|nr:ribonuclease H protein [Trifolium medium]